MLRQLRKGPRETTTQKSVVGSPTCPTSSLSHVLLAKAASACVHHPRAALFSCASCTHAYACLIRHACMPACRRCLESFFSRFRLLLLFLLLLWDAARCLALALFRAKGRVYLAACLPACLPACLSVGTRFECVRVCDCVFCVVIVCLVVCVWLCFLRSEVYLGTLR